MRSCLTGLELVLPPIPSIQASYSCSREEISILDGFSNMKRKKLRKEEKLIEKRRKKMKKWERRGCWSWKMKGEGFGVLKANGIGDPRGWPVSGGHDQFGRHTSRSDRLVIGTIESRKQESYSWQLGVFDPTEALARSNRSTVIG